MSRFFSETISLLVTPSQGSLYIPHELRAVKNANKLKMINIFHVFFAKIRFCFLK